MPVGGSTISTYDLSELLITLTNLIPDGDMELSSWTNGNYSTTEKKFGARSQYFTSGTTRVMTKAMTTLPVVGHKYYGRHYIKTVGNVNADDCRFEWYAGDGDGLNYVFGWNRGNYSDWTMESSIITVSAVNGSSYNCRSFMVNPTGVLYADGLMIVDLTDAFGSGNEPDLAWCDANIPFFTGTLAVSQQQLSSLHPGDILNCPYAGSGVPVTLPKGMYKLECWGAQGGSGAGSSTSAGAKGGYSTGLLNLQNETTLYLYTGGSGQNFSIATTARAGGFNGGGSCVTSTTSSTGYGGGAGGGGSDIRIGQPSLYSRVIVAGGGGGGGYVSTYVSGAGGGTSGIAGIGSEAAAASAGGGTQTAGGTCSGTYDGTNGASGTFGIGGDGGAASAKATGGAGGGGWYGGAGGKSGSNANCTPGGGGSGYVYTTDTSSNYPSDGLLNSSYYLSGASTVDGTTSFTSPTGTTETGHSGNGYIRITVITSGDASKVKKGDIFNYQYVGSINTAYLPAGTYKLECWGAQGGSYSDTYTGGKGGYSVGTLTLTEDTLLYIKPGGAGGKLSTTGLLSGGYNGGGDAYTTSASYLTCSGGGASDIRIGADSLYARVIVAGGGGGANGSITGYGNGGAGGGLNGVAGVSDTTGTYMPGQGGTQTAGGISYYGTTQNSTTASYGTIASFGQGGSAVSSSYVCGGGGGWYGGGYARRAGGGGGSGYVYTSDTASNYPSGCSLNSTYYLTDASTVAGSSTFNDPDGTSVTGHSGGGYVRITVLDVPGLNFKYKVSGSYVDITSGFVKVNGAWKEIDTVFGKIDGLWYPLKYLPSINMIGSQSSFTLTGDTSSSEKTQQLSMQADLIKGHKYYFSCEINQSNLDCSVDFYWPISEPSFAAGLKASTANTWEKIGKVNTRDNWDSGTYPCRIDNNNMNTTGSIQYRNFILVDLTAAYGVGYEPDEEWCNEHIKISGSEAQVPDTSDYTYFYTGTYLDSNYDINFVRHGLEHGNTKTWEEFINSQYNSYSYNDYVFAIDDKNRVRVLIGDNSNPVKKDYSVYENNDIYNTDDINNCFICIVDKDIFQYVSGVTLTARHMNGRSSHVGDYVLYAGGYGATASSSTSGMISTVNAFNSNLVRSNPTSLSTAVRSFGGSYVEDYALFAGGARSTSSYNITTVNAYSKTLTKTNPTSLSTTATICASGHVGQYALFAGGGGSSTSFNSTVNAYNNALSRTNPTSMSVARGELQSGISQIGNYTLFVGGETGGTSSPQPCTVVDVYDTSLTRTTLDPISGSDYSDAAATRDGATINTSKHAVISLGVTFAWDSSLTRSIVSKYIYTDYGTSINSYNVVYDYYTQQGNDYICFFDVFDDSFTTLPTIYGSATSATNTNGEQCCGESIGQYIIFAITSRYWLSTTVNSPYNASVFKYID